MFGQIPAIVIIRNPKHILRQIRIIQSRQTITFYDMIRFEAIPQSTGILLISPILQTNNPSHNLVYSPLLILTHIRHSQRIQTRRKHSHLLLHLINLLIHIHRHRILRPLVHKRIHSLLQLIQLTLHILLHTLTIHTRVLCFRSLYMFIRLHLRFHFRLFLTLQQYLQSLDLFRLLFQLHLHRLHIIHRLLLLLLFVVVFAIIVMINVVGSWLDAVHFFHMRLIFDIKTRHFMPQRM
mmetsp:Transcript_43272/g.69374  ORF Transcript_43272/g.69374 Transcript_43272/m.69374 type:complete len:237 (-) Transcript_43272:560-1270(-)